MAEAKLGHRLYLARHGKTDVVERTGMDLVAGGGSNPGLSETGYKQGYRLGKQMALLGVRSIYTTPLDRGLSTATETAGGMKDFMGIEVPVYVDPRLIERNFGDGEGAKDPEQLAEIRRRLREYWISPLAHRTDNVPIPGMEPDSVHLDMWDDFLMSGVLKEGEPTLIIGHWDKNSMFAAHKIKHPDGQARLYALNPTGFLAIDTDGERFELVGTRGLNRVMPIAA